MPPLNEYMKMLREARARIYATSDWHPVNHISFKAYGGPWPPHCIQGSKGAEFHPDLKPLEGVKTISKATNPSRESCSGFDGTELGEELRKGGVKRVFIGGLATDYCVKNTVLDTPKFGFEVVLLTDAIRGINVRPDDGEKAVEEMVRRGAEKATLIDIESTKR